MFILPAATLHKFHFLVKHLFFCPFCVPDYYNLPKYGRVFVENMKVKGKAIQPVYQTSKSELAFLKKAELTRSVKI